MRHTHRYNPFRLSDALTMLVFILTVLIVMFAAFAVLSSL